MYIKVFNKVFSSFILFIFLISLFSCEKSKQIGKGELVFKTGFEKDMQIAPDNLSIIGTDKSTGYSWKKDMDGRPEITKTYFLYDGAVPECAFAEFTEDPFDQSNRVLHLQVNDNDAADPDKDITRSQFGIKFHESVHFDQCFMRFKMMLHEGYQAFADSLPGDGSSTKNFSWFMIHEIWEPDNRWRVSLFLEVANHKYYWRLVGDDRKDGDHKWEKINNTIPVPVGEWFNVEIYFTKGSPGKGRLYYAVNGEVVFDIRDQLLEHSVTPQPGLRIQPFKIYQGDDVIDFMRKNDTPCQVYFDDFEYWTNFPTEVI